MIKIHVKNTNGSDPKLKNVMNRVHAFLYAFGLNVDLVENKAIKRDWAVDFNPDNLTTKDIIAYTAICSQVSSIIYHANNLWDCTLSKNRPQDGLSAIRSTKKRITKPTPENYSRKLIDYYDKVWYLREILEKKEYEIDEKINWQLNKKELFAIHRLIAKIKDKVELNNIEWTEENAISSFEAFLNASVQFPIFNGFRKHFTLSYLDANFLKVFRHIRSNITLGNSSSINDRFDQYFADLKKSKNG